MYRLSRRSGGLYPVPVIIDSCWRKAFGAPAIPKSIRRLMPRWDNPEADPGETRTYLVVDEPAALVSAASSGIRGPRGWTHRTTPAMR